MGETWPQFVDRLIAEMAEARRQRDEQHKKTLEADRAPEPFVYLRPPAPLEYPNFSDMNYWREKLKYSFITPDWRGIYGTTHPDEWTKVLTSITRMEGRIASYKIRRKNQIAAFITHLLFGATK